MDTKINLGNVYIPSENIVAREVQGEFIIIPITSGIADMEDELFSLNETGKAVWKKLDGKRTLADVIKDLFSEFEVSHDQLKKDVLGIIREILDRKMIVEVKKA
ncbi:MAG: PqqD family protein [Candidatus Omnitrophota bacterium]